MDYSRIARLYTCTWENFGGGKFWQINGSKVFGKEKFGESFGSLLKTLAFINIGGEYFGELPTVHQIHQNFPTYGTQQLLIDVPIISAAGCNMVSVSGDIKTLELF